MKTKTIPAARAVAGSMLLALLAACGGGSSSDPPSKQLEVTFNYAAADPTYVAWAPMKQEPSLQGMQGETPNCVLSAGVLPEGVSVNKTTCAIEGTPLELGSHSYTVQLTVDGFSGSVSASGSLEVRMPSLVYDDSGPLSWKESWTATPSWETGFTPPSDATVRYAVVDSSLPAGLSIDAGTGVISGTFTGLSAGPLTVRATLSRAGAKLTADSPVIDPVVNPPSINYSPTSSRTVHVGEAVTVPAPLFSDGSAIAAPFTGLFSVYTGASGPCADPVTLPKGLSLDAATGVITGKPLAAFNGCLIIHYAVSAPDGGGSVSGRLSVPLTVLP